MSAEANAGVSASGGELSSLSSMVTVSSVVTLSRASLSVTRSSSSSSSDVNRLRIISKPSSSRP